jgi:uncharacterized 2Fe-2S/4Fe-4S cluster protein (DUF4445 family)
MQILVHMAASTVRFQPFGSRADALAGASLLDIAGQAGVPIESICGGAGKCGKCKVVVRAGTELLRPPTKDELDLLSADEVREGTRLACEAVLERAGDVSVEVPEGSRRGHHRLLASGIEPKVALNPAMRKVVVTVPPATLDDIDADDDRLLSALRRGTEIADSLSHRVRQDMPDALREGGWTATVTLFRDREVVRIEPGDTSDTLHGIAIDIGTTKVVAYLIDLTDGEVLATESMPNPQIPFGEDVMSRITYTARNEGGLDELHRAVVGGVNKLISALCRRAGIENEDVLEVMAVGNTAMHHMFLGIPSRHLATAPYAPAVRTGVSLDPMHVGVDIYPFGRVSALPNIAGFVGADAMAVLLSTGLYEDEDIGMLIDIGTNTEIIAGNRDRLVCCSAASGPAFEGAHIRHGMRASTGAIERVWIEPGTYDVVSRTVDDAPAKGICGSGIVDAISEMFRTGILDPSGKIADLGVSDRIRRLPDGSREFVLTEAGDDGTREVAITQKDVQEIQLAKAAIFSGTTIILGRLGIACRDLSRVYAAGAFGTYVDAASAINIGMYPDVPESRIRFVGNAAGSGARMALKSVDRRDLAERLSRKVEYVELATQPEFQKEFAMAMFLPHRDVARFPSNGCVKRGTGMD